MTEKARHSLRWIINSVILAGVILCVMGSYYSIIKAGIPYQDPPLELQIQYAVNMRIGEVLLGNGAVIVISGGIIRLLLALILKKHQEK